MKTLRQVGEFNFISWLSRRHTENKSIVKGIGDDAAVVRFTKGTFLLFTADMLIEDVHFKRTHPPQRIGHKAISCSLSDIAAMGGMPRWALVSVGLPQDLKSSFAKSIYRGMNKTAQRFGVTIIGGDTNCSKKIIIDVFLAGVVERRNIVYRGGARHADHIFVTGTLGGSASGRHLRFCPRIREARFLTMHYPLRAMIDISDGLINDLRHILRSGRLGALLRESAIPLSPAASSVESAYGDGEDFELLFTVPRRYSDRLLRQWPFKKTVRLSRIGEISAAHREIVIEGRDGKRQRIKSSGYEHFK